MLSVAFEVSSIAKFPKAMLFEPVVLYNTSQPIPILLLPVVSSDKTFAPKEILFVPSVKF